MTRILLIRHGSTDPMNLKLCGRLPGIPLNPVGVEQANAVGQHLRSATQLSAVYSSPLQRATETARLIARLQTIVPEVTIEEQLNELDFGDWTGSTFQSLHTREEWHRYNANRSLHAAPRGESLLSVQTRSWERLSEISGRHVGDTIAVVTHADVIRVLLVLFLGMALDQLLRIEIAPASITEINLGGDYPAVTCVNMTCSRRL